ncbi:unnamed protein product [Brachionus calyciflorus]|uniref:Peptidase M60 domain-containing protein n=1 Tax=Brachionus calyciflorus TaxID=104777 RepID=A0A813LZN0_9BILA|nr:unnamed protein product [Brachionus calyciflorus]
MEKAIQVILDNVIYVPKCGNPGSLIVYGSNAYPILAFETSSVIFAAAEYGKGRVFVTSHELYLDSFVNYPKDFGKLWSNIKRWLTNGEFVADDQIRNLSEFESVREIIQSKIKIIKWPGNLNKSEIFINQLKKYVENGGAIMCGICPWGWLNNSHGKSLEDMSLNKFLSQMGICLSSIIPKIDSNYIKTKNNRALNSHFINNVKLLESNMNQSVHLQSFFINSISYLPNETAFQTLDQLQKILYKYIIFNYKPTFETNVTDPIGRALLNIAAKLYQKYSICGIKCRAPNIEEFPSCILLTPETLSSTISIKSKYDEFHFTGYYLPPGITGNITVLEGNPTGWEVRIGSHTDDLIAMNSLKRWPCITSNLKLRKTLSITSAFGGLIYLESPKGNSTLKLKFDSVVQAPHFDVTIPETLRNWTENSQASSPWAELSGKYVSICVPSASIRKLKNPSGALNIWDQIIKANHDLRGTNVENTWRERIVVDIQPNGNFIHAGYPIVVFYSFANVLFDKEKILTHCWSIIHEFGHNIQRLCWVPEGTTEALANLFAFHSIETISSKRTWDKFMNENFDEKIILDFELKNFSREEWLKNEKISLYLYIQLLKAFGWNSFKMLFREYESIANKKEIFKTETDKWDQFIIRFSNIVGLNVTPLFYFWGIAFSDKCNSSLNDLTPWLPNDSITKLLPERVKYCRKNYNFMLYGNESMYTSFQDYY